jgi:hypothetical protein
MFTNQLFKNLNFVVKMGGSSALDKIIAYNKVAEATLAALKREVRDWLLVVTQNKPNFAILVVLFDPK